MTKNSRAFYSVPYVLWLGLFVISPMLLILYQSFFDITGAFTFSNYANYFSSGNYLRMTLNSFLYAFIITLATFLVSYPTALFLSRTKHKQLWLSLIILPTWINLLLKAYAFIECDDNLLAIADGLLRCLRIGRKTVSDWVGELE